MSTRTQPPLLVWWTAGSRGRCAALGFPIPHTYPSHHMATKLGSDGSPPATSLTRCSSVEVCLVRRRLRLSFFQLPPARS